MASYTLHLGFHWDSPVIGSVFGDQDPTTYRTLQYALADAAGKPAWFNFASGDAVTVVLWNLTQSSSVTTESHNIAMSFLVLEGTTEGSLPPSTYVTCNLGFGATAYYGSGQTRPYLSVTGTLQKATQTCPWGASATGGVVGGTMTFNDRGLSTPWSFKWSFCVKATSTGSTEEQTFLSDPEVIIGSQGRPPTLPGPATA